MRMFRLGSSLRQVALAAGIITFAACSGASHSSTPTQPEATPSAITGASISGQVTTSGAPASGIEVHVDGSAASARTDSSGSFSLAGVPTGDEVLRFQTSQSSSAVSIPKVQPSETIQMSVAISGSTATIESMSRSSQTSSNQPSDPSGDPTGTEPTSPPASGPLTMSLAPSEMETCGGNNHGNFTVFVRGTGFDQIDTTSLTLSGDDTTATPITPDKVSIEGDHLKAQFKQSAVFALLLQPLTAGETRVLTLNYVDTSAVAGTLTADLTISDCTDTESTPPSGPLAMSISPTTVESCGATGDEFEVVVSGTGSDQIDPSSLTLSGDDASATPISPVKAKFDDGQLEAEFNASDVYGLLLQPLTSGETRVLTLNYLDTSSVAGSLTANLTITDCTTSGSTGD